MIITLDEARKIDPNIEKDRLNALETMVRVHTNNTFVNNAVSCEGFKAVDDHTIVTAKPLYGIRSGDSILLSDTGFNDGVYTIDKIDGTFLTLSEAIYPGLFKQSGLYKVNYPSDIKEGVKRLIKYDLDTSDKTGIKSESIGRMSVTYYDNTAAESVEGYPAAYLGFLNKYKKLRW